MNCSCGKEISDITTTCDACGRDFASADAKPRLPLGWIEVNGRLVGPYADLRNANLEGADLRQTRSEGDCINYEGPDLRGVISGGIVGEPSALPDGWKLVNGYLVGPGADLTRADLTNGDLSGVSLDESCLRGAVLDNAELIYADMESYEGGGIISGEIVGTPKSLPAGWKILNGYLIGERVNLRDAQLKDVNFENADLFCADLEGANLDGAELGSANLFGVSSGEIIGIPRSLPSGWKFISGYLVGPGAYLYGAQLVGADLSHMDLHETTLSSANLRGSNLTGTDLRCKSIWALHGTKSGEIVGVPRGLPKGFVLANGYLIGPGADVEGADVEGADLSDATLSGIHFNWKRSTEVGVHGNPRAMPKGWRIRRGKFVQKGLRGWLAN